MNNRKVAVITGATAGIGLAAAIECAKAGMRVIGVGRSEEKFGRQRSRPFCAECPRRRGFLLAVRPVFAKIHPAASPQK